MYMYIALLVLIVSTWALTPPPRQTATQQFLLLPKALKILTNPPGRQADKKP